MQSSFAAWADPNFVFRMPDETPFGIDHSLHGRPIIDYQGQPSMHDILRLQRLVQQFANKVKTLLDRQEAGSADAEARHERHQEILDLAEATFKELSLQSFRADKALAVDTLWDSLSLYLNHCASQAGAAQPSAPAAADAASQPADSQEDGAAQEDAQEDGQEDAQEDGAASQATTADEDATATTEESAPVPAAQEPLSRSVSTSTRLAALEHENMDMKAQIASLNARLAQHAQHAEQLLAGTEAFFGDKAGTIIGQPLEEEDSGSNMSFSSVQERSFSRPMSAASSYDSARSKGLSSSSRSASPALCMRGLNRAVGSSTTLGSPMESGISTASFETARVDALTRSSSGQDSQLQTVIQGAEATCAGRHGKREALKAFLHKLRHAPATHASATSDTMPASAVTPGQQEGRAVAGSRPSVGAAADRAAAHQFSRALSHKTSLPASPEKQAMTGSPFAEDPAPPTEAGLEAPQKGMGVGAGVPPSTRVRTLSRQFSDKTQQSQIARSLIPSRLVPNAPLTPEEPVEESGALTGRASTNALSLKSSSKGSSSRASSKSPSIAEEVPGAAANPKMSKSIATSAVSASTAAAPAKPSPKQRTVNRSITSAVALGSSSACPPKLIRSKTGLSSATKQPGALGSIAAGKVGDSNNEVTPLQLGLGKAVASAASAGNVVGHLFGFSAPDSAKLQSVFGGGAFGGLGSGFSFAAGSSAGLPSGIKSYSRGIAAEAAAAEMEDDDEQDGEEEEEEELHAEEEDEEEGNEEAEEGEEEDRPQEGRDDQGEDEDAQAEGVSGKPQTVDESAGADDIQTNAGEEAEEEEDDCNFALPDDLFSGDEDAAAAAAIGLPASDDDANEDHLSHANEESQSHAESDHIDDRDDASHADGSEDEEAASQHEEDASHKTADGVAEQGASKDVPDTEQASVERAEESDEDVAKDAEGENATESDDDSQYEDGIEGDEDVVHGASDSWEIDEPSFVDSQEDLEDSSNSDDDSVD